MTLPGAVPKVTDSPTGSFWRVLPGVPPFLVESTVPVAATERVSISIALAVEREMAVVPIDGVPAAVRLPPAGSPTNASGVLLAS